MTKNTDRISKAAIELTELGLGGTAAGTGLNAVPGYRKRVVEELNAIVNSPVIGPGGLRQAGDYFEAMQSMSAVRSSVRRAT